MLMSVQFGRAQYITVVGHVASILCYALVLLGIATGAPRRLLPYFLLNVSNVACVHEEKYSSRLQPLALFTQIVLECLAHYRRWWSTHSAVAGLTPPSEWRRRARGEWALDATLLGLAVALIIVTHLLICTLTYRAYKKLESALQYERHEADEDVRDECKCSALYEGRYDQFNGGGSCGGGGSGSSVSIARDNCVRCRGGSVVFV